MTCPLTLKVDSEATIEIGMLKISWAMAASSGYQNSFPFQKACLVLHSYLLLVHLSRAPIEFFEPAYPYPYYEKNQIPTYKNNIIDVNLSRIQIT